MPETLGELAARLKRDGPSGLTAGQLASLRRWAKEVRPRQTARDYAGVKEAARSRNAALALAMAMAMAMAN